MDFFSKRLFMQRDSIAPAFFSRRRRAPGTVESFSMKDANFSGKACGEAPPHGDMHTPLDFAAPLSRISAAAAAAYDFDSESSSESRTLNPESESIAKTNSSDIKYIFCKNICHEI